MSSRVVKEYAGDPSELIPLLQRVQADCGFISPETVRDISRWLRISENEVFGVATFFAQFRFTPPGEHVIKVCLGTACHVRGGEQIMDVLQRRLDVRPGGTTADGKYQLERVACLGCCALAPVLAVDGKIQAQASVLGIHRMFGEREPGEGA
ncbi:MAG TPA: NAD(P)H-dependent oxidoreductase subunit E [Candidatus Saccharimonadales bacterium]|nr:NAD(P)H-dependent oxidoreductase subunit E [Candidatus Saccharimonadales bacterium]